MKVQRITNLEDAAACRSRWNQLAGGIPFRRWEWLATWWRYFGDRGDLYLLLVTNDAGEVTGIAPWWIGQHALSGRVVRSLGSGSACSDYLGVLCDPSCQEDVSRVLADWLVEANRANGVNSWDMLHLDGVENGDPALQGLLGQLTQRGCTLHRQPGMNCWRIPLPSTWEAYLKQLPKPQRKRMRDARKSLSDPGEFQVACVADTRGWERAWSRFVELHQRRRTSLGQPGCFTDTAFGAFLQDAAAELMRAGVARLVLVERGDQAIGALLTFTGATTCYAYQMGTNPDCLADSPGWLLVCAALQAGLERHESALDLLRGDEPYKGRMGGVPRSMLQVRVVPPQLGAQLRHSAWLTGSALKSWIKAGLRTAGFSKTGPSSTWSTST